MGYRSNRGNRGRSFKKKSNSDFIRLTGLWPPRNRDSKAMGIGNVPVETLEEILEKAEENGAETVGLFLMKNDYAESKRDPRYVISALPVANDKDKDDDDDDDNRGRRRSKKRRSAPPASSKKRSRDDDDEEEDEEDDVDDEEQDDDDVPF